MSQRFSIGLVGYSRTKFDKKKAQSLVEQGIQRALQISGREIDDCQLVSGWTNMGIPKIGYEYARKRSLRTVGIAPARARSIRCGVFPVDKSIVVGKNFGNESRTFIEFIDILVRVGGGPQSHNEVALFRTKHRNDSERIQRLLIEFELDWLG